MPGDTPLVQFAWHNWVTSLLWHRLARRAAAPPCLSSGTSTRRLPFTPWCLGASCMHTACEQRRVWRAALLYVYPVLCVRSWTCVCAERVFLNTQLTSGLGSLGLAVSLYPVFAVQCAPERRGGTFMRTVTPRLRQRQRSTRAPRGRDILKYGFTRGARKREEHCSPCIRYTTLIPYFIELKQLMHLTLHCAVCTTHCGRPTSRAHRQHTAHLVPLACEPKCEPFFRTCSPLLEGQHCSS